MSEYFRNLIEDENEECLQEKSSAAQKDNKVLASEKKKLDKSEKTESVKENLNGLKKVELDKPLEKVKSQKTFEQKKAGNKPLILSLVIIVICIPLTVVISYLSGDTHYYIASVIILILAMIPFFVNFEHKKPDARKLVVLAVMTAFAVAARVVFMWVPYFTPMAGIIIITAAGFGAQAGFMCGSLSMIVSNIIFGQGPWTPWQMFCYGLIGFIAGLLAKPEVISELHRVRSAIVSCIMIFVLSGAILDTCTIFLSMNDLGTGALAVYIAGVPFNAIMAAGNGIIVLLLLKPILDKLNRIKVKYGME